jgi:hypothetical protein
MRVLPRPDSVPVRYIARLERTTSVARASSPARRIDTTSVRGAVELAELQMLRRTVDPAAFPNRSILVFEATQPAVVSDARGSVRLVGDSMHVLFRVDEDSATARWFGAVRSADSLLPPRSIASVRQSALPELAAPPAPPAPAMMRLSGTAELMVAGARLQTLGAALRDALQLPEGVLVLQALRGTPSYDSGLRDGDIIQQADGREVRQVEDVLRAFEASGASRRLVLQVRRKDGPARTLTVRW